MTSLLTNVGVDDPFTVPEPSNDESLRTLVSRREGCDEEIYKNILEVTRNKKEREVHTTAGYGTLQDKV